VTCQRLAAVGRFSASLAHEIRNPLATIGGFAKQLLDLKDPAKAQRNLKIIVSEIEKLEDVLNNLLEFSSFPAAKKHEFLLREFFDEIVEVFSIRMEKRKAVLRVDVPPDLVLSADKAQMGEVMRNLITNSLDSLSSSGVVTVKAWREDADVIIEVSDNGTGFPPEQQKKVFEPFFTTKSHGTGLGLTIVKKLYREEPRRQYRHRLAHRGRNNRETVSSRRENA